MAYTTIDDPSVYFHTQLYTGDGASSNSITNDANAGDFKPDWLWVKNRTTGGGTGPNIVFDTTRGNTKDLHVNNIEAEHTNSNVLLSFDTDGFSVGTSGVVNNNTDNFVAWQWKANGGTTSSNSDGSITSTVQANTTAGFSIVTWTGTGSDATVGHGLSSAPEMYVVKNRSDSADWRVGQTVAGNTMTGGNGYYMEWNDTKASTNPGSAVTWGSTPTAPTSSVFTVGSNNAHNGSSDNMLAYCFHSVQGYSKISSYTGNGNEDGPFVYTGFKPQWILFKNTGAAEEWVLQDTTRNPNNPVTKNIRIDSNIAEADASNIDIDFLSNGFKNRSDQAQVNSNGVVYIYMAFAENPFVSSKGVPVTAR